MFNSCSADQVKVEEFIKEAAAAVTTPEHPGPYAGPLVEATQ